MRPVRLELRGFGAFRDLVDIDFEDTDFFALVGPTGSGKSTIIDALCFALYGKIPRLGSASAAGTVTSLGATEAVVRLTFSIGHERFVVARILRLGRTKEVRFEQLHDDGTTTTLAAQARETDRLVESVVGLTFEHFTRCVVLPQGEFARFLHDEPKDRRALLVRLLGLGAYESIRKRADEIGREAATRAAVLGEQLASSRVLDAQGEAVLRARGAALAALDTQVADALDAAAQLDLRVADLDRAIEGAMVRCAALGSIIVAPDVDDLGRRQVAAAEAARLGRLALAEAAERRDAARAARAEVPDLASLTAVLTLHERVAKGLDVVRDRTADVTAARQAEHLADAAINEAEQALAAVRVQRDALVRSLAAHDLAAHLVVGEPCPVCEQRVVVLPTRAPAAELARADRALVAAENAVDGARRAHRVAAAQHAEAAASLAQANGHLATLSAQLEGQPSADLVRASLRTAQVLEAALSHAEHDLAVAQAESSRADLVVEQLSERARTLVQQLHRQRDPVADLDPPAPTQDVVGSWRALAAWAMSARVDQQQALDHAREARSTAVAGRDEIEHAARAAAGELGLGDVGFGALPGAIGRAAAAVDAQLRSAEADRVRMATLATEVDQLRWRSEVAAALALHLRSDRFQDWLVSESLDVLAAAASTLLHRLSGGQFSLRYDDNEFAVVDHRNGDEQRPARTLSGGETFQASLALALALAEHIAGMGAGGAAALDAIFLDEGFGTLDADSLETVAETIESLGGDGRMVGIVTHVRELAERVPVRYVVTKLGRTSTVERVVG